MKLCQVLSKNMSNNNFKFNHFLNGIWTLSMFDDINVAYHRLKSIANIYAYLFAILIIFITYIFGSHYTNTTTSEQVMIYGFIALSTINISSLLYGVYTTLMLIPPSVSWFFRIGVMGVLLSLFIFCGYTLDKYTKKYNRSFNFKILDSLIIGLSGISVIEDIYFLTVNTHILLITLALPLHLSATILTIISVTFISITLFSLACNEIAHEAFQKSDYLNLLLITIDVAVKTMTMGTVFGCIWFNVTILPISYLPLAIVTSLLLTGLFTYIYYLLDCNFELISHKEKLPSPSIASSFSSASTLDKSLRKNDALNKEKEFEDSHSTINRSLLT